MVAANYGIRSHVEGARPDLNGPSAARDAKQKFHELSTPTNILQLSEATGQFNHSDVTNRKGLCQKFNQMHAASGYNLFLSNGWIYPVPGVKKFGQGAQGSVEPYCCDWGEGPFKVAGKNMIISNSTSAANCWSDIRSQWAVRGSPYIINPLGVTLGDVDGKLRVCIVMEAGTTSLYKALEKGKLTTLEGLDAVLDGIAGVKHMHSRGVIWLDPKSQNLVYVERQDGTRNWAATDFDMARHVNDTEGCRMASGTVTHCAPEQFNEDEVKTEAADVWGIAVMVLEVLSGAPIQLGCRSYTEIIEKAQQGLLTDENLDTLTRPKWIPEHTWGMIKLVVQGGLQYYPEDRLTLEEVEEWVLKIRDLLANYAEMHRVQVDTEEGERMAAQRMAYRAEKERNKQLNDLFQGKGGEVSLFDLLTQSQAPMAAFTAPHAPATIPASVPAALPPLSLPAAIAGDVRKAEQPPTPGSMPTSPRVAVHAVAQAYSTAAQVRAGGQDNGRVREQGLAPTAASRELTESGESGGAERIVRSRSTGGGAGFVSSEVAQRAAHDSTAPAAVLRQQGDERSNNNSSNNNKSAVVAPAMRAPEVMAAMESRMPVEEEVSERVMQQEAVSQKKGWGSRLLDLFTSCFCGVRE